MRPPGTSQFILWSHTCTILLACVDQENEGLSGSLNEIQALRANRSIHKDKDIARHVSSYWFLILWEVAGKSLVFVKELVLHASYWWPILLRDKELKELAWPSIDAWQHNSLDEDSAKRPHFPIHRTQETREHAVDDGKVWNPRHFSFFLFSLSWPNFICIGQDRKERSKKSTGTGLRFPSFPLCLA